MEKSSRPQDAPQKKKRRTLRDAESDLEQTRLQLQESQRQLISTARENAKMKVLLMKYIDSDTSLNETSQLSSIDPQSQNTDGQQSPKILSQPSLPPSQLSLSPNADTTVEEADDSSLIENSDESFFGHEMDPSQLSHISQLSQISNTSNLEAIINYLDKQDGTSVPKTDPPVVVRVGVGVLLMSKQHPGCVLVGLRKGSHGAGKYALPGGHLEMYESWEECAIREIKEETNIDLDTVQFAHVTNDPMRDEGKHYITIATQAIVSSDQKVENMEPHKCEAWEWKAWTELQTMDNLFIPLYHLTRTYQPTFP